MSKCRRHGGSILKDTEHQVATVVMETVQLVLRQFTNLSAN